MGHANKLCVTSSVMLVVSEHHNACTYSILLNIQCSLAIIYQCISLILQEQAKIQFGCDEIKGVELENQGGRGTTFVHWEHRVLGVYMSTLRF